MESTERLEEYVQNKYNNFMKNIEEGETKPPPPSMPPKAPIKHVSKKSSVTEKVIETDKNEGSVTRENP